ncbi:hypothetical protein HRG84_07810 [Flavisolibacter sp. BT320]|nr:hypothetical protein [Flavisolibacter longurius]
MFYFLRMQRRGFTDLDDLRLVYRGNKILGDLFSKSVHSVRQIAANEADAKGFYRFLQNCRVSEDDIVSNYRPTAKLPAKANMLFVFRTVQKSI